MIDVLLGLTGYVEYGDPGLGGTTPAWMTAKGRAVIAASGLSEPRVQAVLAQVAAGTITHTQAHTLLAA